METSARTVRTLAALAGALALSSCATTRESIEDCRLAAQQYCERTVKAKGAAAPAQGGATARTADYQACLEPQIAACGAR